MNRSSRLALPDSPFPSNDSDPHHSTRRSSVDSRRCIYYCLPYIILSRPNLSWGKRSGRLWPGNPTHHLGRRHRTHFANPFPSPLATLLPRILPNLDHIPLRYDHQIDLATFSYQTTQPEASNFIPVVLITFVKRLLARSPQRRSRSSSFWWRSGQHEAGG